MSSVDETIKNVELVDFKNKSAIALQALLNGYKVKAKFDMAFIRIGQKSANTVVYSWDHGLVEVDESGKVIGRHNTYEVKCFVEWIDAAKEIEILF